MLLLLYPVQREKLFKETALLYQVDWNKSIQSMLKLVLNKGVAGVKANSPADPCICCQLREKTLPAQTSAQLTVPKFYSVLGNLGHQVNCRLRSMERHLLLHYRVGLGPLHLDLSFSWI